MLLDVRADHLKIVQDILQKFVPDREVWAFGSRAKWLAKEYSDLDLCIVGDAALSFRTLGLLEEAFEDSDLPYKVDVVDWATTSESFRKIIERDKVVVQKAGQGWDMPSNAAWSVHDLKDCATWYSGGTPSRAVPTYWNGAIPWISAKSLVDFYITDADERVTEEGARSGTRLVPKDTILFVVRGMSLKSEFRIGLTTREVTFNQDLKALVVKDGIHAPFLAYAIRAKTDEILQFVGEAGHGTGVLPTDRIQSLKISIPPLPEQEKIAGVAQALDFKISLNRRINQTLEAMAQAIFKSWFVDFDPVKAKIAAKAALTPALSQREREEMVLRAAMRAISGKTDAELDALPLEHYQQLATTAALFPDEMVDSELGEIPRGWLVNSLGDVTDYLNRGISPKYLEGGGVLVLNQKCIRDFRLDVSKGRRHDPEQRKIDGRTLDLGDVLINSTGVGTLGRVAQVHHLGETTIVDSHVTVVRAGHKISASYLGQYISWKQPDIEAMGEGSTGQTELSRSKLAELPILRPHKEVLITFDALISPLQSEISARERESVKLAELRDTLLPKLLSGELSVAALNTEVEV